MNIRGRLLLTAAAALALPIAVQAAPPVVIGDGSVCMDVGDGPAVPGSGNTPIRFKFNLAKVIIDAAPKLNRCSPKDRCAKGDEGCRELNPPNSVAVTYQVVLPNGKTSTQTIVVEYKNTPQNPNELTVTLRPTGANWKEFGPIVSPSRKRVIRHDAAVVRVEVDGVEDKTCSAGTLCRVTFHDPTTAPPSAQ